MSWKADNERIRAILAEGRKQCQSWNRYYKMKRALRKALNEQPDVSRLYIDSEEIRGIPEKGDFRVRNPRDRKRS